MDQTNTVWIDALDFDQKGGWKEDTQYVHLMGSGYLIAATGRRFEDAISYSANIENLFFAGWNISVTHIALGTVRVQNTIAAPDR